MLHLMDLQDEVLWLILSSFGMFIRLAATNRRLHTLAIQSPSLKGSLHLNLNKLELPQEEQHKFTLHPWMKFATILTSKYSILREETLLQITKHPWKKITVWNSSLQQHQWNTAQLTDVNFWWQTPKSH